MHIDLLKKKTTCTRIQLKFNWGILFVFSVFFVYNFLQLYKDIRVLQGNLQPVNKTFWCHDISAQVRFISASFNIVQTDTFPTSTKMRRLSVLQRARDIETSHSLMSLHGRSLA